MEGTRYWKRRRDRSCVRTLNGKFYLLPQFSPYWILLNLLRNAVRYTEDGKRIRFCVHKEAENENSMYFVFTVEDNGSGMSPERPVSYKADGSGMGASWADRKREEG